MPPHHYSRVATVEDLDEHGFPTSVESVTPSSSSDSNLPPPKNDETATTIMPQAERREKHLTGEPALMDVLAREESEHSDVEAAASGVRDGSGDMRKRWQIAVVLFVVWFSGTVVFGVARKMCTKKA